MQDSPRQRSTLLLQMAMQVVEEDPNAAASLAMESLQDGVSFGFQQVLIKIQEKNVELSQRVFRAALSRLRSAGMLDPNELLILYAYLYTPGRIVAANTDGNTGQVQIAVGRNPPQIAAAAQLNPALALDFLQLAANLLLNAPLPATTANPSLAARSQLSVINGLMGPISEQLPELAVALRTHAQQISTEAQLNTAPPAPPANRPASRPGETSEIAYAKAALATTVQNYARGWNLAGKIEDRSLSDNLKNWLSYRATLHFVSQNNLEKAYDLAAKNNDPVQRAASLVIGAQQLIKTKDNIRATQWLVEARSLVRKVDPDETSVHVAFGIVSAFAKLDRVTAFDVLAEAVRQMGKTTLSTVDED